jgi:ubiquinone/menaquinone biosynthesis C-methylase UbiE
MQTQEEIYKSNGDRYEALVAHEDHQGNILRMLREITPLEGRTVIDLGAGTGRLTSLLAPHVARIHAFDVSREMLRVCRAKMIASRLTNWQVQLADHRRLPLRSGSADLAVSGWSVSYLAVWNPGNWRSELGHWLDEMKRVLRRDGHIVLYESLGTGNETPRRLDHLMDVYNWLEEVGFAQEWIRTDYRFRTVEEAESLTRFFFGDDLGDSVRRAARVTLPECTGVWWKWMDRERTARSSRMIT